MDDVEAKLKERLSEEELKLLNRFLNTPPSRIRDLIGWLMEEAEKG